MGMNLDQLKYLSSLGLSLDQVIELEAMSDQPKARSANAERQARWRSKRRGGNPDSVSNSVTDNVTNNALPPPIEDHTPPIPSNDGNKRTRKAAKPEGVSEQTWDDFCMMRNRQKAPISTTAMDGIRREAEKAGWTLEAALSRCVMRNWRGFEAEWVLGKPAAPSANDHMAHLSARSPPQPAGR